MPVRFDHEKLVPRCYQWVGEEERALECAGSTALWGGWTRHRGRTKAVSSHRTPKASGTENVSRPSFGPLNTAGNPCRIGLETGTDLVALIKTTD